MDTNCLSGLSGSYHPTTLDQYPRSRFTIFSQSLPFDLYQYRYWSSYDQTPVAKCAHTTETTTSTALAQTQQHTISASSWRGRPERNAAKGHTNDSLWYKARVRNADNAVGVLSMGQAPWDLSHQEVTLLQTRDTHIDVAIRHKALHRFAAEEAVQSRHWTTSETGLLRRCYSCHCATQMRTPAPEVTEK